MEPERETKVLPGGTAAAKRRSTPAVEDVRVVGRYELLSRLGHGGMATVYLGRAVGTAGFQKQVAVKIIHPHLAEEPELLRMFLDEARIAALIHHANVVQTLDLGEDEGTPFIVMELVEGVSLEQLVHSCEVARERGDAAGVLPPAVSIRIVRDVCLGLAAAHDLKDQQGRPQGLVHRDVSPHNVLVTFDGWTKIGDFGIAKAASRTGETRPGELRGKLGYMSPEQARGELLDRRTDLFAVGVVLWELLMGRRMYGPRAGREGLEGDREVLDALLRSEAPPLDAARSPALHDVEPEVIAGLQGVLDRLLAKDRERRYADAHEVSADLGALQRRCEGDSEPRAALSRIMKARFASAEASMRAALQLPPSALARARHRSASHAILDANPTDDTRVLGERREGDSGPRAAISARPVTQELEPLETTPTPTPAGVSGPSLQRSGEGLGSISAPEPVSGRAGSSLRGWLSLVVVVATAGLALTFALRTESPIDGSVPASTAATTPAPPSEEARVTWHVDSDPPGAEVWVADEKQSSLTPLDVVLDRGEELVKVEVRLADHRTRTFQVAPLADHSFAVELVPSPPVHTRMATSAPSGEGTSSAPRRPGGKRRPAKAEAPSAGSNGQPSGFKPMPDFGREGGEGGR